MAIYAGIGSREIDSEIESLIFRIGKSLGKEGWTLYSGGAIGCDFTFEKGCDESKGSKRIFLPWKNFGNKWDRNSHYLDVDSPSEEAIEMVKKIAMDEYPEEYAYIKKDWNWKLLGRNMHQILGHNLKKPVNSVVCYTKNAEDVGGTRWALRIARKYNVPIYNLGKKETKERFEKWLKSIQM